jgi:hypothetical protein
VLLPLDTWMVIDSSLASGSMRFRGISGESWHPTANKRPNQANVRFLSTTNFS